MQCSLSKSMMCIKKLQKRSDGQYPRRTSFQEKTFSPSSVKAQKRFGLLGAEVFKRTRGLAVFTVNVNVITVSVVMLISSLLGWYVT